MGGGLGRACRTVTVGKFGEPALIMIGRFLHAHNASRPLTTTTHGAFPSSSSHRHHHAHGLVDFPLFAGHFLLAAPGGLAAPQRAGCQATGSGPGQTTRVSVSAMLLPAAGQGGKEAWSAG
eukprot:206289-Hanusia_phi.AAC.2